MLEPADSQEAYDLTLLAIEISERWQHPGAAADDHARLPLQDGRAPRAGARGRAAGAELRARHPGRVMIPAYARPAHRRLRAKLAEIAAWNET
jgi:indolepyruvate ferredoxin oxidoreductase, alpha subunit